VLSQGDDRQAFCVIAAFKCGLSVETSPESCGRSLGYSIGPVLPVRLSGVLSFSEALPRHLVGPSRFEIRNRTASKEVPCR
jgi:hypothetical protein